MTALRCTSIADEGVRRRLTLVAFYLVIFLAFHLVGAVVGPMLLGWPTMAQQERETFCLTEARNYAACIRQAQASGK